MDFQQRWASVPAGCRFFVASGFVTMLFFFWCPSGTFELFYFSPRELTHGHIWTLFTSPIAFYPSGPPVSVLINILITMWMIVVTMARFEQESGTTLFLYSTLYWSVLVRLLFLFVAFVIDQVFHVGLFIRQGHWNPFVSLEDASCVGLWPIIFFYLSLACYRDLDNVTSFWGVVNIPNRYFPLAFYLLFALMSQSMMLPSLIALALGYGEVVMNWNLQRFLPTASRIADLESRFGCRNAVPGCIPPPGHYASPQVNGRSAQRPNTQASSGWSTASVLGSSNTGNSGSNVRLFGGQGQRLGSAREPLLRTEVEQEHAAAREPLIRIDA